MGGAAATEVAVVAVAVIVPVAAIVVVTKADTVAAGEPAEEGPEMVIGELNVHVLSDFVTALVLNLMRPEQHEYLGAISKRSKVSRSLMNIVRIRSTSCGSEGIFTVKNATMGYTCSSWLSNI